MAVARVRPVKERLALFGQVMAGLWWGFWNKGVLRIMTTTFATIAVWSFNALVKSYPGRAKEIIAGVFKAYTGGSGTAAAVVSEYIKQMTGTELPIDQLIGKPIGGWSDDATKRFIEAFFKDMLITTLPTPDEVKADPLTGAEKYLSANIKFQMDSWWMHVMADIFSMGMFKSLKDLPNAISWGFGLGWLSWLVMGTPFKVGIVDPLTRKFNSIYLPEHLSASQLIEAKRRGYISDEYFNEEMLQSGYSPEVGGILWNLSHREMSRLYLQDAMVRGMISPDQVEAHFKDLGYSADHVNLLTRLVVDNRFWDTQQQVINAAIDEYADGFLSEADLLAYLTAAKYTGPEQEMVLIRAKITRDDRHRISDAEIYTLYERKQFTWVSAIKMLTDRGFSDQDAELYMKAHVPVDQWFAPKG